MYLKTFIFSVGVLITASSCFKKPLSATAATLSDSKHQLMYDIAPGDSGLRVVNGIVKLNGKVYSGIGVNYFNAFYRTILNNNDTSYIAGLDYLSSKNVPFIRFASNGFWPKEWNLYLQDSVKYFTLLDKFVKAAEKRHIGLIPSLFFNDMTVCDKVTEHRNQWGNLNSRTIAMMRRYTASMVARYKNSPAIWGWEFGNEMNAYVDLHDMAGNYLPHVNVAGETPPMSARTLDDAIRTTTLDTAYREFARVIHLLDTVHMVFTGNAMPEWNMWHRHAVAHPNEWGKDSETDFGNILDAQNPAAIGSITVHFYYDGTHENRFTTNEDTLIKKAMLKSIALKRPLFVGEFGAKLSYGALTQPRYEAELNAIVNNQVPLSALWVYDFSAQDTTFNVTQNNTLSYQLQKIIDANAQLKAQLGY